MDTARTAEDAGSTTLTLMDHSVDRLQVVGDQRWHGRRELGSRGIRVNAVAPGAILSDDFAWASGSRTELPGGQRL